VTLQQTVKKAGSTGDPNPPAALVPVITLLMEQLEI